MNQSYRVRNWGDSSVLVILTQLDGKVNFPDGMPDGYVTNETQVGFCIPPTPTLPELYHKTKVSLSSIPIGVNGQIEVFVAGVRHSVTKYRSLLRHAERMSFMEQVLGEWFDVSFVGTSLTFESKREVDTQPIHIRFVDEDIRFDYHKFSEKEWFPYQESTKANPYDFVVAMRG